MPMRCTCWASWPARRATPDAAIDLIGRAIADQPRRRRVSQQPGRVLPPSGAVGPGDRQFPPRDRIEARPGRGPQQPGQRPHGPGPARRGDRRLPPGHRAQARSCRGPQQPGHRPARIRAGSTRRSPPTDRAIAAQARPGRGPQQPGQCPARTRAGSTRRSPPTAARSSSSPIMPRPTTTSATP